MINWCPNYIFYFSDYTCCHREHSKGINMFINKIVFCHNSQTISDVIIFFQTKISTQTPPLPYIVLFHRRRSELLRLSGCYGYLFFDDCFHEHAGNQQQIYIVSIFAALMGTYIFQDSPPHTGQASLSQVDQEGYGIVAAVNIEKKISNDYMYLTSNYDSADSSINTSGDTTAKTATKWSHNYVYYLLHIAILTARWHVVH